MAAQGAMPSPLTPALSDNSAGQNSPPSNLPAGPMVSVTQLSSLYHNLQVLAVQFQGLCETLGHVVHDIEATRAVQTVGGHHHEYGAVSAPLSTASAVSGPVKPFFWTQHTGPQPPTEVVDHSLQHQHHSTDHASTIASLQNKVSSLSNLVPAGPVPSAHDVNAASPLTPSSHQNTATNNLSARSLSGIPPISTLPPTLPLEHSNSYTSLGASSPTSSPPLQPNSAVPASPLTPDAKTNAFASAYPASHSPPRAGTSAMSSPASAGPRVAFAGSSNSEHNRSGQRITGLDEADVEVDVEITPPAIVSSVPFTAQSLRPRLSQRRSSGPSPSSSSGTLVAAGESSNHLPALPLSFSSRTSALPPPVRSVSSIDQFQSTSTSTNKPSAPTVQTKSFVYDKFAGRRGGPRSYSVIGAPSDIPRCASMPVLSLDDLRMATEQSLLSHNENRVTLNVGGQVFVTTRTTLSRSGDCMLSALVNSKFGVQTDADGAFFIDRDPTYFRHILNFLRDGSIEIEGHTISQNRSILREARFYQIKGLVCLLEEIVKRSTAKRKSELSDEKVYKLHANVETTKLNEVMNSMTLVEGYDFESWLPGEKGKHHMLFSKKLSRGELALLDQLENKM